jgi:hypothetical protein
MATALSLVEQDKIQAEIDEAGADMRRVMKFEAEERLKDFRFRLGIDAALADYQQKEINEAIETIVRLEATELGKGAWFRFRRRAQLVHSLYSGK